MINTYLTIWIMQLRQCMRDLLKNHNPAFRQCQHHADYVIMMNYKEPQHFVMAWFTRISKHCDMDMMRKQSWSINVPQRNLAEINLPLSK